MFRYFCMFCCWSVRRRYTQHSRNLEDPQHCILLLRTKACRLCRNSKMKANVVPCRELVLLHLGWQKVKSVFSGQLNTQNQVLSSATRRNGRAQARPGFPHPYLPLWPRYQLRSVPRARPCSSRGFGNQGGGGRSRLCKTCV